MSTLPSQSFQCSHCVLIFKSKAFLLEHLSKVHGLGVDTDNVPPLKTNAPPSNLKHNTNGDDDSGGSLACRHCTFTASDWDVVHKHERMFHPKLNVEPLQIQKRYLKGKLHIIRRPGIQVVAASNKTKKNAVNKTPQPQHEDETGAKVNSSTSKAKCTSSSATDIKTYKRPSGPITKFLVPSVKLPDPPKQSGIAKETLILRNPHPSSAQDSTGVLKVTATSQSQHDLCIRHNTNVHLSQTARVVEDLLVRDRERLMVGSIGKGSVSTEIGKRAHEDISESPPKKRPKTDVEITESPESTAVEAKLSCSSNFAFEVSEDEDEGHNLINELDKKVDVVNVDHSVMYSCKHCGHTDMVADDMLTHYEKGHPYIRCNSAYIKDPRDQTARFRCLECPVEYPYIADLRLHYRVSHPEAPDVFQMQSCTLCFKCFVCPYTTLLSESLKDHYHKQHPSHIVINPLIYCKFNATIVPKEEMSQVDNTCETKSIPKTPDQGSLKSAATADKEMPPVEMSQVNTRDKTPSPKAAEQDSFRTAATLHGNTKATPTKKEPSSKGLDRELHECKNCKFTHMSAVAMLVHYQRNHPERGVSIDQIKMAHMKSQTQAPVSTERNSNKSLVSELSHQKPISDSLVKQEDDAPAISPPKVSGPFLSKCVESPGKEIPDLDPNEVDRLFFCQVCNYSDPTVRGIWSHQRARHGIMERNSEEIHLHTAAIRSRCKTSAVTICPPQTIADTFAGRPSSLNSPRAEMFYCSLCDHCNPTMKGISSHLNSQHVGHVVTTVDILMHSATVNKERGQREAMASASSSDSNTPNWPEADSPSGKRENDATCLTNLSTPVAGLIFCQKCHYGAPTVGRILIHQAQKHRKLKRSHDAILRCTSMLHGQIQESPASPTENLALTSTGLPLPIIEKGEEYVLFCHLCNFRHNPSRIREHYKIMHPEVILTHEEIVSYSLEVHERMRNSCSSYSNASDCVEADSPSSKREIDAPGQSDLSNTGAGLLSCKTETGLLFCHICHYGHQSVKGVMNHQARAHAELKRTADQVIRYTSTIRKQIQESPASPTKNLALTSSGLPLPIIKKGEEDMSFCHVCNFKHKAVIRVMDHFNTRHPEVITTIGAIVSYSLGVHEQIRNHASYRGEAGSPVVKHETDAIYPFKPTVYNASNRGEAGSPLGKHEDDDIYPIKPPTCSTRPSGLFFCQKCNYGHSILKSVLCHQTKRHPKLKKSMVEIVRYTSMIRRQMKELKSPEKNLALTSTGLPLPIIEEEEGDEDMLFCHLCNFPQKLLTNMTSHFRKMHPEVRTNDTEIVSYSFDVHKRLGWIPQMGMPAEQAGQRTSFVHGGNEEAPTSKPGHNASFPSSASKAAEPPTRSLWCHKCPYNNPHVYLLKRHISQKHNLKFTSHQILTKAFKDGSLPAGYHCEWCVFSHKSAENVYRHCQDKHPLRCISLQHIAMRLYVGPTASSFKTKSTFEKKKPSGQSGKNETKVYPCRECSFKGSSLERISSHCREVHPWTIKEDGSVLNVNEPDMPAGLPSSDTSFQCPFCPAHFFKSHGLHTHLGIKHPEYQSPLSEDEKEDEMDGNEFTDGRTVYKCPLCAYVNTVHRGILAHCQKRHPKFKARADILQKTKVQFPNEKECCGNKAQLYGYMCRICPVARGSTEKLKLHYEQAHNQTAPNFLKPAPKQSTVMKNQLLSKYRSMQSSALQATSFKNKMPGGLKCTFCKHYQASTNLGLRRHINMYHRKESEAWSTYYPCTLCSFLTHKQNNLGRHYRRSHGTSAPLNYETHRNVLAHGSSTPAMDIEKKYKCQLCAYSGRFRRYLWGHYSKRHGRAALKKYLPPPNKGQPASQCGEAGDGDAQCKKCNLTFRSPEFLAVHFTHYHREDFRVDFTVLNSKNYTYQECQPYQCGLCGLKIKGTKKLCSHLDDHRRLGLERANAVKMTTPVEGRKQQPPTQPLKVKRQEELQEFETIEDLAKWNVTKVETFTLLGSPLPPSSPPSCHSSASKMEELPTHTRGTEPFACRECPRTFTTLTGLRKHEHSHAGDTTSDLQISESFDKYIRYREGTSKPYQCAFCSYRTGHVGLVRSHLVKKHQDISSGVDVTVGHAETKPAAEEPRPPLDLLEEYCWSEPPDEPEFTEKPVYAEPPDVQRQLGHYKRQASAASAAPDAAAAPHKTDPPEDTGLLCCEYCNFSSEHLSSIRRHYLNRHNGKKLLRCKDCSFFTGSRKTLEKHVELGHTSCPSEPTHQKDLRCPLCLYQSKNKNNMIDHVMLHREERVIPIEVRRPKLSRYLDGIVFRCHKCTFTCSSDENLRLHALKHDDLKPYKCRLCYFDCTLLGDLEAHLCDKHQVVRNHELVGQINVDLLEARTLKKAAVQKKKAAEEDATRQDANGISQERQEDSPSEQCKREDSPSEQCKGEDSPSEQCKREDSPYDRPPFGSAVHQAHAQEEEDATDSVGAERVALNTCRATHPGGTAGGEEEETCRDEEELDAKSLDGPFLSCEEEEEEQGETDDELVDAYEELPALDDARPKEERVDGKIYGEHSYALPETEGEEKDEDPCGSPALDGDDDDDAVGDVVCGVVMEEVFVCTLCGRYLRSGAQLERHVLQHGL